VRLWPFSRRRRYQRDVDEAQARGRLEIQRLKIDVAKQVAAEDPRTAAALLWGGARGAAQTLGPREPSIAEKYLEHKLLKDADEDGFERMLRVREMIREERAEVDSEYGGNSNALTSALERFGPTLLAGLAATLNPAGYQAALVQAQNQQAAAAAAQAGQPMPPLPGGTQLPRGPETVSGAVPTPAEPPEQLDDDQEAADNADVLLFPLRASTVLANLDAMPPAVFARWILEQPVLGTQMAALAQQSDDQIWQSLEVASTNPLAGEFSQVFAWLRGHPQQATAIVESMRAMTIKLDDADDVAI
jgi:hypothetical protein